jgi:hypothetical protein
MRPVYTSPCGEEREWQEGWGKAHWGDGKEGVILDVHLWRHLGNLPRAAIFFSGITAISDCCPLHKVEIFNSSDASMLLDLVGHAQLT